MNSTREIVDRCRPHTIVTEDRLLRISDAIYARRKLQGDMIELGVYNGGTAMLMGLSAPARRMFALDTFHGIPYRDQSKDFHGVGEFACQNIDETMNRLLELRIKVIKGNFPGSVMRLPPDVQFVAAHFDADTHDACHDFLQYVVPRLVRGGCVIVDDYGWENCRGVTEAVNNFLTKNTWFDMDTFPQQAIITFEKSAPTP